MLRPKVTTLEAELTVSKAEVQQLHQANAYLQSQLDFVKQNLEALTAPSLKADVSACIQAVWA